MQPDPLSQAIEHFRCGRLDAAEERCRFVLDRNPDHTEVNQNRPSPKADFNEHSTHILHRFARLVTVAPGEIVAVLFRHDRSQIGIDLLD